MASNPPGDCPGQAGARFRHRPCQGLRDVFCIVPAFPADGACELPGLLSGQVHQLADHEAALLADLASAAQSSEIRRQLIEFRYMRKSPLR